MKYIKQICSFGKVHTDRHCTEISVSAVQGFNWFGAVQGFSNGLNLNVYFLFVLFIIPILKQDRFTSFAQELYFSKKCIKHQEIDN